MSQIYAGAINHLFFGVDNLNNNTNKKEEKESFFSSIISFILLFTLVLGFKSSILDANNIPTGSMIPTLKIGDFLFVNKMRYSIRWPFSEVEILRFDDPKRGDIVTFIPPTAALRGEEQGFTLFPKRFVKRVIGIPGDTIRIRKNLIESKHGRGKIMFSQIEYKEKNSDQFIPYSSTEIPVGKVLDDLDNVDASAKALFLEKKRDFTHYAIDGFEFTREGLFKADWEDERIYQIPDGYYMMVGDNRDDSFDSREWGFVPREDVLGKALVIYFSINWKDHTCMFKNESELAKKVPEEAEKYKDQELYDRCADLYGSYFSEEIPNRLASNAIEMSWIKKTLFYRIKRMEFRWKRIGTILQ